MVQKFELPIDISTLRSRPFAQFMNLIRKRRSGIGIFATSYAVRGAMSDEDEQGVGAIGWFMERAGVIIGAIGLIAWFFLLWFMFGDVL